jgi:starvation-inducible DNA-binding protein
MAKADITSNLRNLTCDNFVVYFKSHGFHFNVQGNTFSQDHSLLQEVYELLWEWHDTLNEQLRQLGKPCVSSLSALLNNSIIDEQSKYQFSSADMFADLVNDLDTLLRNAQWLFDNSEDIAGLNTLMGDYAKALSKINWKLKSSISQGFK